jgi:hypothetical protein
MSTQPRSQSEHYSAAERLLSAANESPASAPLLALAHAVLTLSPRKARRVERQARHGGDNGLPPHLQWGAES